MTNITEKDLKFLIGKTARLWRFFPSHDRLTFQIGSKNGGSPRYLIFLGCEEMKIPVFWLVKNPEIKASDKSSYQLIDGSIQIHFEESKLTDHYELR